MDIKPTSTILATPSPEQDSLSSLAEVDIDMIDDTKSVLSQRSQSQRGVRIDDHYYFQDNEPEEARKKPGRGLNDYQTAWNISDSNNESDDLDEVEMEDAYETESNASYEEEQSEMGDTTSEMHVDLSPEEEAIQYVLIWLC
jgi:hypothetical protein